jgi:hypothetical protein
MLRTHYRQPIDWTFNSLDESHKILWDWYGDLEGLQSENRVSIDAIHYLCDDLNPSQLIAELHRLRRKREFQSLLSTLQFLGFSGDKSKLARTRVPLFQNNTFDVEMLKWLEKISGRVHFTSRVDDRPPANQARDAADAAGATCRPMLLAEIFRASIEELGGRRLQRGAAEAWASAADDEEEFGARLAGELTLVATHRRRGHRLCRAGRQFAHRHALCASGGGRAGRRRHALRRAGETRRRRGAKELTSTPATPRAVSSSGAALSPRPATPSRLAANGSPTPRW